MASPIGTWNPAWGPEPQWQGPAKQAAPKKRYRWYTVSCTCTAEEYMVHHPGPPDYTCARCGAAMQAERIVQPSAPRATSVQPGERYGQLVVLDVIRRGKAGCRARCRCDCGTVKDVAAQHLRDGSTKSCGCLCRPSASHPWRRSYKTQRRTS